MPSRYIVHAKNIEPSKTLWMDDTLYNLGIALHEIGDYRGSEETLTKLVSSYPNYQFIENAKKLIGENRRKKIF